MISRGRGTRRRGLGRSSGGGGDGVGEVGEGLPPNKRLACGWHNGNNNSGGGGSAKEPGVEASRRRSKDSGEVAGDIAV